MSKITYANKVAINENAEIPNINKITDDDMNEIKTVVNNNDDDMITINTNLTNATTYSTTEKIVGTWIDGKPIYRKIYEFSNISPSDTKYTALGIDNLYRIVNWGGSVETNGTARSCFVSGIVPFVHYQNGNIYVANTGSETINSISVIIEYTKTPD